MHRKENRKYEEIYASRTFSPRRVLRCAPPAHTAPPLQYGMTALMYAARWGHKEVVEVLLGRGADLQAKDEVRPPAGPYMRALPALTPYHLNNKLISIRPGSGKAVQPIAP